MYVYAELGPRVSEGSNASRKYVLESGKSLEFRSEHGEVQRGAESPYTPSFVFWRMHHEGSWRTSKFQPPIQSTSGW
jgi:hypothetical protein